MTIEETGWIEKCVCGLRLMRLVSYPYEEGNQTGPRALALPSDVKNLKDLHDKLMAAASFADASAALKGKATLHQVWETDPKKQNGWVLISPGTCQLAHQAQSASFSEPEVPCLG